MSEERKSTEARQPDPGGASEGPREVEEDLPNEDLEQLIRAAQAAVLHNRNEKRSDTAVLAAIDAEGDIEEAVTEAQPESGLEQKLEDLARQLAQKDEELAQKDEEIAQFKDRMLRLAAEFDNYKKRSRKERSDMVNYANEDLIKQFLPVLDNFDRALETGRSQTIPESFFKGIELIYTQAMNLMERVGLKHFEVVGQLFDPNLHEAVMRDPNTEVPENIVVQEFRRGYLLNDKIIRQALVSVSSKPSGANAKTPEPDQGDHSSDEAPLAAADESVPAGTEQDSPASGE